MFGRSEPEPRVTVAKSRTWLIEVAGVHPQLIHSLLYNARREGVIIYTEDKSLTDQTPVYILDSHPQYGGYRTLDIVSMIQHLDGA